MPSYSPLRCDDVTREIAAPTGRFGDGPIDGHLDACASCAEFARRSRRLDDLWAEARPSPPVDAFATIWANVESQAGAEARPARPSRVMTLALPERPNPWRRRAIVGLLLAQAAAVAGIWLSIPRRTDLPGPGPGIRVAANQDEHDVTAGYIAAADSVDIDTAETVVIRIPRLARPEVVRMSSSEMEISETETVDIGLMLFAHAENMGAQ